MAMGERSDGRDSGFTLMEVVMAMTLFTVGVTITLGMIMRINTTARDNDLRITAASLMSRQVESIRSLSVTQIPDGLSVSTTRVGNNTFTIRQSSSLVAANSAVSLCESTTGSLAYRVVSVTVTWPNMGRTPPPRADTLKVVGVGELNASTGTIAVAVKGTSGQPQPDIRVTLTPSAATVITGDDGCAVFSQVTPGVYNATINENGFVGPDNLQGQASGALVVSANQVVRSSFMYDNKAWAPLALESPSGYTPAGVFPIYMRSSYVPDTQLPTPCGSTSSCLTGLPGQVRNLIPGQYSFWAGSCHDTATRSNSKVTRTLSVTSTPATVVVPMAKVWITVFVGGASASGRTITVTHAAEPSGTVAPACSQSLTYTLTSKSSGLGVLLPYGYWTFQTTGGSPVNVNLNSTPSHLYLAGK